MQGHGEGDGAALAIPKEVDLIGAKVEFGEEDVVDYILGDEFHGPE